MPATSIPTKLPEKLELPSDQDSTGRTLGDREVKYVTEAIRSGTLTSTKGTFTKRFETAFAEKVDAKHAIACASGSAAIHVAVAALKLEPGDEVITTSITDMGALTPILFQGGIPVFADVDPTTWNVTAHSIRQRISEKTRGIIVTHLFGNPCDMDPIMEVAREHDIPVIEDCAQAFLATYRGRQVGTLGDIGCFSLQQGKHITTGEGGICVTNNEHFAREIFLFVNKAWGYGDAKPDHYYSALNYRLSELQGAVALAQLEQLDEVVSSRVSGAAKLTELISDLDGIRPPVHTVESVHTYWKYCLSIDAERHPEGAPRLAALLRERGIACAPRYIQKPAFECEVFRNQRTLGDSRFPFNHARPEATDYDRSHFPGTYRGLEEVLVLPWNEAYTQEHIEAIARAVIECVEQLDA
ncbi:MAG: DegT/DnrJ/EryC1/StrS family aminotransferase [Verrucomicrobiota bacterium]